ncbi:MAG: hypothetical protein ACI81L_002910 [Verrucomicrobiales bacterium]|jgi:hypothetical protein
MILPGPRPKAVDRGQITDRLHTNPQSELWVFGEDLVDECVIEGFAGGGGAEADAVFEASPVNAVCVNPSHALLENLWISFQTSF